MRIGLCHKTLDMKGGTELDFYHTARGLSELGHEVHLFCSDFVIAPPAGVPVHRIPIIPFGRTARLWSFAAIAPWVIRRYRCDLVVSFGRVLYQDVLRCGGGSHRVFLSKIGAQSGRLRRLWQSISLYHRSVLLLEKQQFSKGHFKLILAVSQEVKQELVATYAIPEDKITVLYNGVDQRRFHPSLRMKWGTAIRQQWDIPMGAPVVLFVGSGFRRKGLDRLLHVWQGPALKNCYLMVVGDDAWIARYRAVADSVAKGRIIFAGRQSEIERYYGAADVVVLPAVQEAFGNVVLEALASGVPVVANQGVGAAELFAGSIAGEVVRHTGDAAELESKLVAMLRKARDPATRQAARELGERYSWDKHYRALEKCLLNIYRQAGSGS
jgi:UDP-glucose:(heptosyl)LPS alpha-1,3-glucosyltransferase